MAVPKSVLKKAVSAARRYLGAVDYAPIRVQQRFHTALMKHVNDIAERAGMLPSDVLDQLLAKAYQEGPIKPSPGKDY